MGTSENTSGKKYHELMEFCCGELDTHGSLARSALRHRAVHGFEERSEGEVMIKNKDKIHNNQRIHTFHFNTFEFLGEAGERSAFGFLASH